MIPRKKKKVKDDGNRDEDEGKQLPVQKKSPQSVDTVSRTILVDLYL